jgi:hypothetical protein
MQIYKTRIERPAEKESIIALRNTLRTWRRFGVPA